MLLMKFIVDLSLMLRKHNGGSDAMGEGSSSLQRPRSTRYQTQDRVADPIDRPSYRYKADWICCVRQACVIASCVHAMVKLSPQNCNLSASIAQKIVKVVSRGPSERDGNVIGIGA
jgi:hypothetical protein